MEKRMESGKFVEGPEASTTVLVDISIEDDALLRIPADDITTVREAVGTFVAWPEHLIDVVPIMYLYDNFVPNSKKKVMFISPHTNILGVGMTPHQNNNTDCGFYVVNFMEEVIKQGKDDVQFDVDTYTIDQIDVNREIWSKFVYSFRTESIDNL
ncbi:hypothetical protein Lal_00000867 [Lupinus albus]|nr:hypothetical protein Lal_00000867 [Lupinus albus]